MLFGVFVVEEKLEVLQAGDLVLLVNLLLDFAIIEDNDCSPATVAVFVFVGGAELVELLKLLGHLELLLLVRLDLQLVILLYLLLVGGVEWLDLLHDETLLYLELSEFAAQTRHQILYVAAR